MERLREFEKLFQHYVENTCTADEVDKLMAFFESKDPEDIEIKKTLFQNYLNDDAAYKTNPELQKRLSEILDKIIETLSVNKNNTGIVKRMKFRNWMKIAAAILIVFLGTYTYNLLTNKKPETPVAKGKIHQDVAPGGNRATLDLGDGKYILLDDSPEGILAMQNNSTITKLSDGQLLYSDNNSKKATEEVYNKLSTPRGGQYHITLSDGSQVWLNAASSIRYPATFLKKVRTVEISGEAYLEVAANPQKPFIVKVNGSEVRVLGTRFNVMAYENEQSVKTTLLQGAVEFRKDENRIKLNPGQQSELLHDGSLKLINNVDTDLIIAWKNGTQSFHNADIATIMRSVERWYDVEVEYKGKIPNRRFNGDIPRGANLSELLKLFEVNKINYLLDGQNKKLTILP